MLLGLPTLFRAVDPLLVIGRLLMGPGRVVASERADTEAAPGPAVDLARHGLFQGRLRHRGI